jgi:hypothetical protein
MNAAQARELWAYDPETGVLTWKVKPGKSLSAGMVAGKSDRSGRRVIGFQKRLYQASRIAWLIVHGDWPTAFIDHINGDPSDNRISNLREATLAENARNSKQRRDSTHSLKGVALAKGRYYYARISLDGERRYLGCFENEEAAHTAYAAAAAELHGEFARTA